MTWLRNISLNYELRNNIQFFNNDIGQKEDI